jgi:hypothetical protein
MPGPFLFLPPIKFRKKCRRCGLYYPRREQSCPHCEHLSDDEVEQLKLEFEAEKEGNANLGKLFLYIAALILLLMIAFIF